MSSDFSWETFFWFSPLLPLSEALFLPKKQALFPLSLIFHLNLAIFVASLQIWSAVRKVLFLEYLFVLKLRPNEEGK